ncbi:MAG TPA: hypothetical protein VFV54_06065, partial [Thermoanaerobaculia bacterium]|nr:hypothetical protein [Thermoanaerobaculia bacterium]
SARYELGESDRFDWTRSFFAGAAEMGWAKSGVTLEWERRQSDDVVLPIDLFTLGGVISSIHPRSALSGRIEVPALPIATMAGEQHEAQRAVVALGMPLRGFYERHRLWFGDASSPRGEWLELAGAEATADVSAQPLLKIPALEFRLGVARILSGPLHGDTTWWVSTVWRP